MIPDQLAEKNNLEIRIVTDSTCDLPEQIVNKHKIAVIPLLINQDKQSFRDGIDLSREEFYAQLPSYQPAPTTAAPSPEIFRKKYEELAEEGAKSILSIHLSESLSATINSARLAAEQIKSIPVIVLDSTQLSLGLGFIVEKAAELVELGQKVEEIIEGLQDLMNRTYVFASLKTLEYLRRSGRMHFALARLGEILKIKPLLHMNQGKPTAFRARTQARATERLFEWLNEYAPYDRLAIVHAGVVAEAESMRERIREFLPDGDIPIVQIAPVLGSHLGIGALGFAVVSKKKQ